MKNKIAVTEVSNGHAYTSLRRFFSYCPHTFAIQDMMATLAAGRLLAAEWVPVYLLPHALLLHAVAPEPGAVDDPVLLTERILEEYDTDHNGGHGPRWYHPQAGLVAGLVYGTCSSDGLLEVPDAQYIHEVYATLTNSGTWA